MRIFDVNVIKSDITDIIRKNNYKTEFGKNVSFTLHLKFTSVDSLSN
jgi:hypothetical protein